MKKLMTLMPGLALVLGSTALLADKPIESEKVAKTRKARTRKTKDTKGNKMTHNKE
jgi:hypothetical protein